MTKGNKTLGEMMKEHRNRLHLTQENIAERIECHPQYYKNLENDKGYPSLPLFCKIIHTLNMSADAYIYQPDDINDIDLQEIIQIFNRCDDYQRSVLLSTGRALLSKETVSQTKETLE